MVLGLRSKSRKSVSIQVQYIIHVQEIKPWPPSQSLRSVQSVVLQWENGDQISGSLASTAGTGKIEFNESFRLSVTMWREVSKKGKHRESFQKNNLEFYLYDKTVKSHLLGSATINFADFGIIKETKALNILLNIKKSSKNSSQPYLFVSIQPFDTECSSSSPSSSLSKEMSPDKEGSESVSHSVKDDEDLEIASFTDDDTDDIPSNTFQTIRSTSKITGDGIKISERGTEGSHREFVLPPESTTSNSRGNTEGEASTQFSDIKSPSPTVLCSDAGNASNGRPLLPKISEKSVKLVDASSEILESKQSSTSYTSSSMKQNFERSFQSQVTEEDSMTQEDGTRDQRFNKDAREKVSSVSNTKVMKDKEKKEERRKRPEQFSMRNERLGNELVNNYSDDEKLNSATLLPNKKSHEHETSIMMKDKTEDVTNVKFPLQSAENYKEKKEERRKGPKQFTMRNELLENERVNNYSDDNSTKKGELDSATLWPNKKSHEHETGILMNDKTEDVTNVKFPLQSALEKVSSVSNAEVMEHKQETEERRKGPEQFTIRNELLENELVSNYSDDDSTNKGELDSASLLPDKKSHEHETSILMKDKTEDMTNIKFPLQSALEKVSNVSNTEVMEDKEEMEERRNGPEQFTLRSELLDNELINNYSGDDSTNKGELDNDTLLPNKKSREHEANILMNDKTEDMKNVKFPLQSALEKVSSISNTEVMEDKEKMGERMKGPEQFTMRNEVLENELVNDYSDDDSTKKGKLNSANLLPNKKSHGLETSILMNDKTEDVTNVKFPLHSAENYIEKMEERRKGPEQFTMRNEVLENEPVNDYSDDDSTKKAKLNSANLLPNKKSHGLETSILMNDKTEDVTNVKFPLHSAENYIEKMEERRKGPEQFTMRNEVLENELVNDYSDDDSTKRKLNSANLMLNKKPNEQETSILVNDKTEDVTNVKFPRQSAENYGLFNKNQTDNQAEEIKTMNDAHVDTACHEDDNVNGSFLDNKTELKAEVERLREELREAAALEVSIYSVIAEHSSSSNKVHAPARRLSRLYFHACRVGSPATIASAAQSAVSGFVLVSKACGNDVPRLIFWFSNVISLRAIVSKRVENIHIGGGPCFNSECDVTGNTLHEEEKDNTDSWEDPKTFIVALEKVEAWIFSRIVESVWWQTLTPYMQSAATKSSSCMKAYEKRYRVGDPDQGSFSIDLWKRAFKDACDRLCPIRAGGHECGCLPVIARLVMEQLVSRLDVAMFNAILRESAEEMPMDPISDPISDSKVLPIPAGKSGFGAGAQLKNAIGDWSRWLSDLFSIDDSSESLEVSNEDDEPKCESSFKPFHLLNALSDLMMLPLDMLADGSTRKEVCPKFGISLIKRVVNNFVPDEFSPGPIPDAVYDALNEDIEDNEGCITSLPCSAGSTFYAPPPPSSVVGMLQEVKTKTSLRSGSFVLQKLYTSDDELDELDSPLSSLGVDDSSVSSKEKFAPVKGGRKVVRFELLREAWKTSE
ncbi:early endosome antigen 1 [Cajanus cajan]|uniref:early endosome antigen 1 n=1 Tax=Cajanus cajan TaxID=3821 RepID=UPI00098D987D|nr:early endosome antigen 1 [Cajanus cajan]XP_020204295.1 early endosome antigen 1 [Cajanus cajan]XP_020204296.1 early endosome antigen 1 [Cajanus cajan]XP_020204298.1 early endosome antigen 1 [Cajanus cajan]XP_020204299.1 early endosome antigen 1 [Cajanus cajan]